MEWRGQDWQSRTRNSKQPWNSSGSEILQAQSRPLGSISDSRVYGLERVRHFGAESSVCIFWFCHLTAVWAQTDDLTSLSLSFFMHKIGILRIPPKKDSYEDIHLFTDSGDTCSSSCFTPGTILGTADGSRDAELMRIPVLRSFYSRRGDRK